MLFNSYVFLFAFLPLCVACYWLVRYRLGSSTSVLWLAAASYAFYVSGERIYPVLLAISFLANFFVASWIAGHSGRERRFGLWIGVTFNLAVLGWFKYATFASIQLQAAGLLRASDWSIVLPIGVSFFTFTQIAYLVDVARGAAAERRLGSYALFVSYFPHLIAGPILHHKEMLPQFYRPSTDRFSLHFFPGVAMLAIGLSKKILLADPCGDIASKVFDTMLTTRHGAPVAWIGAINYALQIYFDFSGYCDMAIGASTLLGIKLPINFNSPYKSHSIIEFWRRWHITLSRFLRDYLYISLGGNRRGTTRRYINLFITMLLGGAWHGAGWTFIVWGALHGTAQTLAHAWRAQAQRGRLPHLAKWVGWTLTMLFVIVAWVPFRAPTMHATILMWRAMVGEFGLTPPAIGPFASRAGAELVTFTSPRLLIPAMAAALAVVAPNSQQMLAAFSVGIDSPGYGALGRPTRWRLDRNWQSMLFLGIIAGLALRLLGLPNEFIYFQF